MTFPKFNRHLHIQGGRFFIDEDGIKHKADQWEHLVNRVADYRKRAGKPPGDPKAEIEAQVCARQPGYCRGQLTTPPPSRPARRDGAGAGNLTARVTKWFVGMLSLKRTGVMRKASTEEARRRAAICARCPMQKAFSGVCGSCKATRKQAGQVLLGTDKRVNSALQGCAVLGEDTSISVHLESEPVNNPELPSECWRK
jgi:hypothetical protein